MTIKVHKADPIDPGNVIDNSSISIVETLNPDNLSLDDLGDLYKKDAEKIYAVLSHHLPRGTRHQLLLLMLEDAKIFSWGK